VLATFTFLAFIALAGLMFLRMLKARDEKRPDSEVDMRIERPKRMSSRERKLAKIKEFEKSIPPRPTIQELMAQEVADTGVDQVPGGDGLEIPVRLKVWHRDEHVRRGCVDGALRFVLSEGVDRANATEDDVMLVCDEAGDVPVEGAATTSAPSADDAPNADDAPVADDDETREDPPV